MSEVFSLRLPKSLNKQVKELAKEEGISMNQFITLTLAEKVGSMQAINYLEKRAARGSREKMLAVLAKAPDVEPEEHDRLEYSLPETEPNNARILAEKGEDNYATNDSFTNSQQKENK